MSEAPVGIGPLAMGTSGSFSGMHGTTQPRTMSRGSWQVALLGAAGGGLTAYVDLVSAWSATGGLTTPGTPTMTKLWA